MTTTFERVFTGINYWLRVDFERDIIIFRTEHRRITNEEGDTVITTLRDEGRMVRGTFRSSSTIYTLSNDIPTSVLLSQITIEDRSGSSEG